MTRYVTSSVHGGSFGVADDGAYLHAHRTLASQHDVLTACAARWTRTAFALSSRRMDVSVRFPATALPTSTPSMHAPDGDAVVLMHRIACAVDACNDVGVMVRRLADECGRLADLVARAWGIYNAAESRNRARTTKVVQLLAKADPLAMSVIGLGMGLFGAGYGYVTEGTFGVAHMSHATSWMQEGLLAGIGDRMSGASPLDTIMRNGSGVAAAAGRITAISAPANDLVQGSRLTIRQVHALTAPVGYADNTATALHDLRGLGRANADTARSGLSYATIAISRYARADGTNAWLVTIPGTDGQADSPLGWEQNVELMSDDATERAHADSARFVAEAMRRAGVACGDPVALIGHSQGGIIAATIASDYTDEFTVGHVVTAGSPIANHPVAKGTWVTSIEMDDELVAALDGAANPEQDRWLTVRGSLAHEDDDRLLASSAVDIAEGPSGLTHDLAYHEAAYASATQLGTPALERHDDHFRRTIAGEYQGTSYWQGRIGDRGDEDR